MCSPGPSRPTDGDITDELNEPTSNPVQIPKGLESPEEGPPVKRAKKRKHKKYKHKVFVLLYFFLLLLTMDGLLRKRCSGIMLPWVNK